MRFTFITMGTLLAAFRAGLLGISRAYSSSKGSSKLTWATGGLGGEQRAAAGSGTSSIRTGWGCRLNGAGSGATLP